MANFSHLEKLEVSGNKTVDFTIFQIEGEPSLQVTAASESNRGYFNELLRKGGKRQAKKTKVDAETIKRNREEDRVLYAKHIVKGWTGVNDADGKPVKFTEGECLGFLSSLPDWLFDELRTFASDIQNFIEAPIDVEDKAKN